MSNCDQRENTDAAQYQLFKKLTGATCPKLNIGVFNARSLCNKTVGLIEYLADLDTDICCVTETWLRKSDTSKIAEIKDLGYSIHHKSRPGRGGGVALIFKKSLNVIRQVSKIFKTFEIIECLVKSPNADLLRICCVYRPGTAKSFGNFSDFCSEFDDFLDYQTHLPGKLIITGDFNIHMEDTLNIYTTRFQTILSAYGLKQHVAVPTHLSGGTLDLVITRSNISDCLDISSLQVVQTVTSSDHYYISLSCLFPHLASTAKLEMSVRNIKKIDLTAFKDDIKSSDLCDPTKFVNVDDAVRIYNCELSRILDKHAPIKTFVVNTNNSKWWNNDCQHARKCRRRAERVHKRCKTDQSRIALSNASKLANLVIKDTRDQYYKNKLSSCEKDIKKTYSIVNHLMERNLFKNCTPDNKPDNIVVTEMKDFFHEKVQKIYSDIEHDTVQNDLPRKSPDFIGTEWMEFIPISDTDLNEVLSILNKKECAQDPIPVNLLYNCLEELKPIILFIVNASLRSGIFPSALKNALVKPDIKNPNGDTNDYKNYRPISNLPFLSKVIEKCVHRQLTRHLSMHNLHAEHQSGYRTNHSCETVTLAIYNDLLCITDTKHKIVLVLLDLSAAFDTINHSTLLSKLNYKFGIRSNVLKWFESYLNDRSFSVTINQACSEKCFLRIGVPQGSILGPILFILYTKELEDIAKRHGFRIYLYADDTQLYIEFNPLFVDMLVIEKRIVECLNEIRKWMLSNHLKLNTSKTEALVLQSTSRSQFNNLHTSLILDIDGDSVEPADVVKSLGVWFDQSLNFEQHVNSIIQSCNIHLRNLRVIASKLSYELKRQLIHCLVFSKLDYCNGLLYGLPNYVIARLQRVQNSCVRFLFGSKMKQWERVTPYLKAAHFLPVKQRIEYKIALTTYKCINNVAPDYLKQTIALKQQPLQTLRNDEDYFLLDVPKIPNYCRTDRSFSYAAPAVWNLLPYELRTCNNIVEFKKLLKTHLFNNVFGCM